MRDIVVSILFEVGEYLPVIVSVALLVVFQTVKKVLREWLGVDVSNDGGTLGLMSLILVVTYSILLMAGREVPGHLSPTISIVSILFFALVIYGRRK